MGSQGLGQCLQGSELAGWAVQAFGSALSLLRPTPGWGLSLGVLPLWVACCASRVTGRKQWQRLGQVEPRAAPGRGWRGEKLASRLSRELLTHKNVRAPRMVFLAGSQSACVLQPQALSRRPWLHVTRDSIPALDGNPFVMV